MSYSAPPVETRTRDDIASQLRKALSERYADWPDHDGAGNALVEVFARYASLVVDRINSAPERSRAAFLSQLGGAPLPPQPATVPLTFALAKGGSFAGVVPAGTQVAAAPQPGTQQPVIFETDAELVVTAAALDQLFVRSPEDDGYADLSPMLTVANAAPASVYTTNTPLEHLLHVGTLQFFGARPINRLTLSFDIEEDREAPRTEVSWEIWNGTEGVPLTPDQDGTACLRQSGDVIFRNLPCFPATALNAEQMHWLRCRWGKRVMRPVIARSLTMEREIAQGGLPLRGAFTNNTALDLTKDFRPLGEVPRFGDVFYLQQDDAFSLPGAQVTLAIEVTNPAVGQGDVPIPRVNATGNACVAWEYWNGKDWLPLGEMLTRARTGTSASDAFWDTTQAFTASGEVGFTLPADPQPTIVAGRAGFWLRARLAANGYGDPAGYTTTELKPGTPAYVYKPASVVAPVLNHVSVAYTLLETAVYPDVVLTQNDFAYEDISVGLRGTVQDATLVKPSAEPEPALYLGFLPPFGLPMPTTPVSVFFAFGGTNASGEDDESSQAERSLWQCWDGANWISFGVVDQTGGFSFSGRVTFLTPTVAKASEEFGRTRYWIRVPWRAGQRDLTAPLRLVLLNTVSASQTITVKNEVLGSINGKPDIVFSTSRKPILEGETLELRDPPHALATDGQEAWTMWRNVPSFHASGPLDRHYVLDRMGGQVSFGDGRRGQLPPIGTGNVRFASYRTGGGVRGNAPPGTIVQLKTTLPYIRAVTNVEGASGGADAESVPAMLERAPRTFRHRSRAVTVEDYEDLAKLASPEVARARCVPSANLLVDPDAKQMRPGYVTLLILPNADGPRPLGTRSLLRRVSTFVEAHHSCTAQLVLTGPEYVSFDVSVDLGIVRLDGVTELETAVRDRLTAFLHPLRGGFDRKGWDFGRYPQRSDLLSLTSSLAGVDHVRSLRVQAREDRPGAANTSMFMACPGEIQLQFTLV